MALLLVLQLLLMRLLWPLRRCCGVVLRLVLLLVLQLLLVRLLWLLGTCCGVVLRLVLC